MKLQVWLLAFAACVTAVVGKVAHLSENLARPLTSGTPEQQLPNGGTINASAPADPTGSFIGWCQWPQACHPAGSGVAEEVWWTMQLWIKLQHYCDHSAVGYSLLYDLTGLGIWALAVAVYGALGVAAFAQYLVLNTDYVLSVYISSVFNETQEPDADWSAFVPSPREVWTGICRIVPPLHQVVARSAVSPWTLANAAVSLAECLHFMSQPRGSGTWVSNAGYVFAAFPPCGLFGTSAMFTAVTALCLLSALAGPATLCAFIKASMALTVAGTPWWVAAEVGKRLVTYGGLCVIVVVFVVCLALCVIWNVLVFAWRLLKKAFVWSRRGLSSTWWCVGHAFVWVGATEAKLAASAAQQLRRLKAQLNTKYKHFRRIKRRTSGNYMAMLAQLLAGEDGNNNSNQGLSTARSGSHKAGKHSRKSGTGGSSTNRASSSNMQPELQPASSVTSHRAYDTSSNETDEDEEQLLQLAPVRTSGTSSRANAAATGHKKAGRAATKAAAAGARSSEAGNAAVAIAKATNQVAPAPKAAASAAGSSSVRKPASHGNADSTFTGPKASVVSSVASTSSNGRNAAKLTASATASTTHTPGKPANPSKPARTSSTDSSSSCSAAARSPTAAATPAHAQHQQQEVLNPGTHSTVSWKETVQNDTVQSSRMHPLAATLPWLSDAVVPAPRAAVNAATAAIAAPVHPTPAAAAAALTAAAAGQRRAASYAAAAGAPTATGSSTRRAGRGLLVTGPGMQGSGAPAPSPARQPAPTPAAQGAAAAAGPWPAVVSPPPSGTFAGGVGVGEVYSTAPPPVGYPLQRHFVPIAEPIILQQQQHQEQQQLVALQQEQQQQPFEPYRPLQFTSSPTDTPTRAHTAAASGCGAAAGGVFNVARESCSGGAGGEDGFVGHDNVHAAAAAADEELCVICMDAVRTHALLHGADAHLCLCAGCCEAYDYEARGCPMCRQVVEDVVQLIY